MGSHPARGFEAVAHPEEAFDASQTVLWTPLFQAAWDDSWRGMRLERVEPPNALMTLLDSFKWDAQAVSPVSGWKVWAGSATAEFIARVNAEAAPMTGEAQSFPTAPVENGRVAFGLLQRSLIFARPFYRSQQTPLSFQGKEKQTPVRFFGVRDKVSEFFRNSVRVLHYETGTHALHLAGSDNEAAVLYLPREPVSFAAACANLRQWLSSPLEGEFGSATDSWLHAQDDVRIPLIKLEAKHDFQPRLQGARFYRGEREPWRVVRALQRLNFDLTEKGAEIKVRVEMLTEPFGAAPEPPKPPKMVPRHFFFDRPFFVFLWRAGAEWPYFGAWIGDASALAAFPAP